MDSCADCGHEEDVHTPEMVEHPDGRTACLPRYLLPGTSCGCLGFRSRAAALIHVDQYRTYKNGSFETESSNLVLELPGSTPMSIGTVTRTPSGVIMLAINPIHMAPQVAAELAEALHGVLCRFAHKR